MPSRRTGQLAHHISAHLGEIDPFRSSSWSWWLPRRSSGKRIGFRIELRRRRDHSTGWFIDRCPSHSRFAAGETRITFRSEIRLPCLAAASHFSSIANSECASFLQFPLKLAVDSQSQPIQIARMGIPVILVHVEDVDCQSSAQPSLHPQCEPVSVPPSCYGTVIDFIPGKSSQCFVDQHYGPLQFQSVAIAPILQARFEIPFSPVAVADQPPPPRNTHGRLHGQPMFGRQGPEM